MQYILLFQHVTNVKNFFNEVLFFHTKLLNPMCFLFIYF